MYSKKTILAAIMLPAMLSASAQRNPVPPYLRTHATQMEQLGRAVVAVPAQSGSGNLVSWRLLGTDDHDATTFDVVRNGIVLKTGLTVTNYRDTGGNSSSTYEIVTRVNGEAVSTTDAVKAWGQAWLKIPLDRPATGAQGGTYAPNDCSVGDVDGDGEYEIFLKWDPSTSKDNSQNGTTDNVYIDCYKLDGTRLWRIDLGRNIRAGAHYTQFQVYDYDGDGHAEMMCKTAPGTKDGIGDYVNQAATDEKIKAASNTKSWVSSSGRIDGGQEYLTVFEGLTGKAIHTIAYNPNRSAKSELSEAAGSFNWDDRSNKSDYTSYGNRGERYLAATACLDGPDGNASAIFVRGYYTYAYIWAVDFDGQALHPRWLHRSDSQTKYSVVTYDADGNGTTQSYTPKAATSGSGSRTMYGNGNHNMSVADVDGDGRDEIIWGSAALNSDGTLRYATGYGHGDAIHVGQMIPGNEGMQVFQIHEGSGYGWDLHDASTGEILFSATGGDDNGRGMAAQLSSKSQEWWFSSANDRQQRSSVSGDVASGKSASLNFRIYWDGTTQDALLDGSKIDKYNDSSNSFSRLVTFSNPGSTCNGSKNTPNLQADILGDWREEVILHTVSDNETFLGIHTSNYTTSYSIPTLMHDHTYRMAICWQNTAYNQPPHLGYNLAEAMLPTLCDAVTNAALDANTETEAFRGSDFQYTAGTRNAKSVILYTAVLPDGTKKTLVTPEGFSFTKSDDNKSITLSGTPAEEGDYTFTFRLTGLNSETVYQTLTLHVQTPVGISILQPETADIHTIIYDAAGHQLPYSSVKSLPKGIYLVQTETANGVVTRKIIK